MKSVIRSVATQIRGLLDELIAGVSERRQRRHTTRSARRATRKYPEDKVTQSETARHQPNNIINYPR